jgi:hypothetical protein
VDNPAALVGLDTSRVQVCGRLGRYHLSPPEISGDTLVTVSLAPGSSFHPGDLVDVVLDSSLDADIPARLWRFYISGPELDSLYYAPQGTPNEPQIINSGVPAYAISDFQMVDFNADGLADLAYVTTNDLLIFQQSYSDCGSEFSPVLQYSLGAIIPIAAYWPVMWTMTVSRIFLFI